MINIEIWKPIIGWKGYEVSNLGRVRSLNRITVNGHRRKGQILKQFQSGPDKYLAVELNEKPKIKRIFIHHLVLETFIGPRTTNMLACHKNDDKFNNKLSNLYWGSTKQNHTDAINNNQTYIGVKNGNSKLTEIQVKEIKNGYQFKIRGHGYTALSKKYNVNPQTIRLIVK